MLLKVDCLPNACWEAAVHTLDLSWKKMDVKLMMMMMMNKKQSLFTSLCILENWYIKITAAYVWTN